MKSLLVFFIVLASGLSFAAKAQDATAGTAKTLADGCRIASDISAGTADQKYAQEDAVQNAMLAGFCSGYVSGFLGGHSVGAHKSNQPLKYCLPSGVTTGQVMRVLAKYVEDHPEVENFEQLPFAVGVLQRTWPCTS